MRQFFVLIMLAFVAMPSFAKKPGCDDNVDMADSLDFHKLHVECADEAISIYDPKSRDGFFTKGKAINVYEDTAKTKQETPKEPGKLYESKPVLSPSARENIKREIAQQDNAGVIFNIREPFTATGGPQSAINGLFAQMVTYCPNGWTKRLEWVEPSETGYYLHYQFRCGSK